MYITYEEYQKLGGGLDETAFNIYGYEAEAKVNAETHGRIEPQNVSEPVKRCIVRLAGIMAQADIAEAKVTSWSNDGVSESIKDVSIQEYNDKMDEIIREYLANEVGVDGVPLLYLGVGKC